MVDQLRNIRIENYYMMVFFDIALYFPSVPVKEALKALQLWLFKQNGVPPLKQMAYIELASACMMQTQFRFRGKFYNQSSGTAMGNPTCLC